MFKKLWNLPLNSKYVSLKLIFEPRACPKQKNAHSYTLSNLTCLVSVVQFFYGYLLRVLQQNYKLQKGVYQKVDEKENVSPFAIFHRKWLKFASQKKSVCSFSGRTGLSSGWQSCSSGFCSEQPSQPMENPLHPSSFTWIYIIFKIGHFGEISDFFKYWFLKKHNSR